LFDDANDRYGGEIRGHYSYHHPKPADRFAAALNAIKTLPDAEALQVAKALLRPAPSFLSGLTPENLKLLRAAAARRFAPALVDQLERSEKIIAHVEGAQKSFVAKFSKMRPKQLKEREVDGAISRLAGVK
jgi:hypothetical protein